MHPPDPARHDVALTADEVEALGAHGWFVRRGFLGEPRAGALAAAALAAAHTPGALRPAAVRRGADRALDARVRSDLIGWVDLAAPGALAPLVAALGGLRTALARDAFLSLGRFDLQLAHYPGGGAHYARHRDAFPGQANRRLTAIWYANPAWEPAHGGQLRLYPEAGAPVDVSPGVDTLVVFLSERLEHEVLPAHASRLALTAWFYGPGT